jgi:hypothetical protein
MQQAMRSFAVLVVMATGLNACTDTERGTTPHNGRDTMPGPGLFSGPPGDWVIFQRRPSATAPEQDPQDGVTTP